MVNEKKARRLHHRSDESVEVGETKKKAGSRKKGVPVNAEKGPAARGEAGCEGGGYVVCQ